MEIIAIDKGENEEMVEMLKKRGGFPVFDIMVDGYRINTLVQYAILRDNVEVLRKLVEMGHSLEMGVIRPLELAIKLNNYMMSKIIISYGVEITGAIITSAMIAGDDFMKLITETGVFIENEDEEEKYEEDYNY
jgi:hypothetical protein